MILVLWEVLANSFVSIIRVEVFRPWWFIDYSFQIILFSIFNIIRLLRHQWLYRAFWTVNIWIMVFWSTLTAVRITEIIIRVEALFDLLNFLFILFKKFFLRMHTHILDLLLKLIDLLITSKLLIDFFFTLLTPFWELHFIAPLFNLVFKVSLLLFFLIVS